MLGEITVLRVFPIALVIRFIKIGASSPKVIEKFKRTSKENRLLITSSYQDIRET